MKIKIEAAGITSEGINVLLKALKTIEKNDCHYRGCEKFMMEVVEE